jgi:hypothetical protein
MEFLMIGTNLGILSPQVFLKPCMLLRIFFKSKAICLLLFCIKVIGNGLFPLIVNGQQ